MSIDSLLKLTLACCVYRDVFFCSCANKLYFSFEETTKKFIISSQLLNSHFNSILILFRLFLTWLSQQCIKQTSWIILQFRIMHDYIFRRVMTNDSKPHNLIQIQIWFCQNWANFPFFKHIRNYRWNNILQTRLFLSSYFTLPFHFSSFLPFLTGRRRYLTLIN